MPHNGYPVGTIVHYLIHNHEGAAIGADSGHVVSHDGVRYCLSARGKLVFPLAGDVYQNEDQCQAMLKSTNRR